MKKLIVTLILGLITVVSFSSCGNSKKDVEKLIVGEWIYEGDDIGHHLMDDESAHIFFNADGTFKGVYESNGVVKATIKGKYYIVNENTIATATDGEYQEDSHFEIIGKNQLQVKDDKEGITVFFKRANN